jgi:hydroxyacylglutathione hydrolase
MIIETFITTPFQQNTRVVACEETRRAVCIDPGDAESAPEIAAFIKENNLELQAITLTHGHLDHVGGTHALHKLFPQVEIFLHKADEDLYYALPQQPILMGIPPHQLKALGMDYDDPPPLTRNWEDGEEYKVGKLKFKILHCPGHTRGHVVLAEESEKKVFVGDCLFVRPVDGFDQQQDTGFGRRFHRLFRSRRRDHDGARAPHESLSDGRLSGAAREVYLKASISVNSGE